MQNEKSNPIPGVSGEAQPPDVMEKIKAFIAEAQWLCAYGQNPPRVADIDRLRDKGKSAFPYGVEKFEWSSLSLAPPESPGPRCPKCGSDDLEMDTFRVSADTLLMLVDCRKCDKNFSVKSDDDIFKLADFAQFFAAPSTRSEGFLQSRCPHLWEKFHALEKIVLSASFEPALHGEITRAMGVLWNEMLNFKAELAQVEPAVPATPPAPPDKSGSII